MLILLFMISFSLVVYINEKQDNIFMSEKWLSFASDTKIPVCWEAYIQSREFVFFPSKNGHKQKINALNGF